MVNSGGGGLAAEALLLHPVLPALPGRLQRVRGPQVLRPRPLRALLRQVRRVRHRPRHRGQKRPIGKLSEFPTLYERVYSYVGESPKAMPQMNKYTKLWTSDRLVQNPRKTLSNFCAKFRKIRKFKTGRKF